MFWQYHLHEIRALRSMVMVTSTYSLSTAFLKMEWKRVTKLMSTLKKLRAELGNFKFDFIKWRTELPREIKDGKSATTSTTWIFHRMISQPSFSCFFPLLSSLAECCMSILSNAWPEKGASALKPKTLGCTTG